MFKKEKHVFTSESVTEGHPDKMADLISDAILDAIYSQDPHSRVACETFITTGMVLVGGEITTTCYVDISKIVRETIKNIGYTDAEYGLDYKTCAVLTTIDKQSPDIALGVDKMGAGDQGMMFGYAVKETPELMPLPISLAQKLTQQLAHVRKSKKLNLNYLRPDGKSQVTVEYDDKNHPLRVDTIVIACQHDPDVSREQLINDIKKHVIYKIIPANLLDDKTIIHINPTGRFVVGGPQADVGLTGRKIIVDTYGGMGRHGGGCVNGDTEFLTLNGWKKISKFSSDDKVAQWEDGKISFVNGEFVKLPKTKMYHIATNKSLDMVLSDNHNVLYKTSKGNYQKKTCQEILDHYYKNKGFRSVQIPIYFTYDFKDNPGLDLTDDEIRLQVAFCAEGTILKESSGWTGRIRVKKKYKKEALRKLFASTGFNYKETPDKDCSIFWYNPSFTNKKINKCLSKCNLHQAQVIADEVIKWDGDRDCIFRTTHKDEADFVQFIFMAVYGTSSHFSIDDRVGETFKEDYIRKSICYEVRKGKYKYSTPFRTSGTSITNLTIEDYEDNDLWMYCINVPSHNLVLRYNNRVFITGNCFSGKDPSKVDRSAAYMARYIAKNIVAADLADEIEVQLAYAIGVAEPVSLLINTFGTGKVKDSTIVEMIRNVFKLTPEAIIDHLKLRRAIYKQTAAYGHFGRELEDFTWEKTDKVDEIKKWMNNKKYD